ncbi:enoyl-CoA hydratase/isomerase family protein [Vagococcus carniphilus]|uniref:Enoyl-CoA hydratase n=2 Tax=Vagococcus carniphilus TaxID=218144 RepID=A0A430ANI2_9ENTE|nr:enoyl-CoA hydratase-related protein [Vagococcus carniphilus]QNN72604.1 enoyl-CoA hydratase/isomerase family protein [Vagococcus carniphilus]RSU09730.1 hypothetical protein CBF28_14540 [Vagococcus carniphilus]
MMDFQKILYNVQEKIAFITLNTPKNLNSFDDVMLDEIVSALHHADEDNEVKVIVLNSSSPAFSGGGDVRAMYEGVKSNNLDFNTSIEKMASVSLTMKQISKPVIASVSGAVAGAGFNVALAADFIIASEDAFFIQSFVNIGLIPDAGGIFLLSRAVGVNKATELVMTGKPVSASQGKELGFVSNIVPTEELEAATNKLAKSLAYGPSLAYAEIKKLVFESDFKGFEEYVKQEVKSQVACSETADFVEGISAFAEKRKPKFN